MKFTSFLVGAAAGAAAVMYMNRTNKTVLMGFSQMGDNLSKVVDKAMMSLAARNIKPHKAPATTQSLDRVEDLIKQDPGVKHEVDQILSNNHLGTTDINKGQLGTH